MAKIKITDPPKDLKLPREEMRRAAGGSRLDTDYSEQLQALLEMQDGSTTLAEIADQLPPATGPADLPVRRKGG